VYGNLIAQLIHADQEKAARAKFDEAERNLVAMNEMSEDPDSIGGRMQAAVDRELMFGRPEKPKFTKAEILKIAEKFCKADHCKASFYRGWRECLNASGENE
jgi:hypothetical protein